MVWDRLDQQGVVPLTATTPSWTTSALPPAVSNAKALPQQATTDLNLVLIPPLIITRCLTDIHQDIHRRITVRAVQALVPVQARDTALRFPADMGVAPITSQCPADIPGRI